MLTTMPALVSREICSGVTVSAATVVNRFGSDCCARINASRSASVIGRISAGSCAPFRATDRCGPSRCSPRKPGTCCCPAATPAATAAAVTSGVSVISVGSSAVVPKCAWAAQMVRDGLHASVVD